MVLWAEPRAVWVVQPHLPLHCCLGRGWNVQPFTPGTNLSRPWLIVWEKIGSGAVFLEESRVIFNDTEILVHTEWSWSSFCPDPKCQQGLKTQLVNSYKLPKNYPPNYSSNAMEPIVSFEIFPVGLCWTLGDQSHQPFGKSRAVHIPASPSQS